MTWQRVATLPIDIDTGIGPARALAIAQALTRRAVPLLVRRDGRAEPIASGAFYRVDGATDAPLALVTCRHLFDAGVAVGDLGVPLGESGRILWLMDARVRAFEHGARDLMVLALDRAAAQACARYWPALPSSLLPDAERSASASMFVLAGYPYAQMRRVESVMHAKPLIAFARACLQHGSPGELCVGYGHTAIRIDGLRIHAPPLDGVSGATLWAVTDEDADGIGCVLEPAGVQYAFKHDAYVRAEPFAEARRLLERIA
jgi:hypothetical protein